MDNWNYDMRTAPKQCFCIFGCDRGGEVAVIYRRKEGGPYITRETGHEFSPVGWLAIPPVNLSE